MRYSKSRFVLLLFVSALILSCVSRGDNKKVPSMALRQVYLTDTCKYTLLPPFYHGNDLDMAQQISASYKGSDFLLDAWVKSDKNEIFISLFNSFGSNMGELIYREDEIYFSSPVFPSSLKSEYIIADFQLCFYDPVMVGKALEESGLFLELSKDGESAEIRRVFYKKNKIIEIYRKDGRISYANFLRDYSYTIDGVF
jgi:hypothetical protein